MASRRHTGPVLTGIFTLCALAVGFLGVNAALDLTQPARADADTVIEFQVQPGESVAALADRLQHQGLIRSALVFRVAAQARRGVVRPGIYNLTSDMTTAAVVSRLVGGQPDQPLVIVPPGMRLVVVPPGRRVTQYPTLFSSLPAFNASNFLKIVSSGVVPGGGKISASYWFVAPKHGGTYYALEGYLLPGTYFVPEGDDEIKVIDRLLDALGDKLCPGPDDAHADAYVHDRAQCEAHAAQLTVGTSHVSVFVEMRKRYFTTDDVAALYNALSLASLVARMTPSDASASGVADVYYNRYLTAHANRLSPYREYVQNLDADSSTGYVRDSTRAPTNGNWWTPLGAPAVSVDSWSAYNTAVRDNTGLPPGPIAAPTWVDIAAAAAADDPMASPYYFVAADRCGQAHFAKTLSAFQSVAARTSLGCFPG